MQSNKRFGTTNRRDSVRSKMGRRTVTFLHLLYDGVLGTIIVQRWRILSLAILGSGGGFFRHDKEGGFGHNRA